MASYTEACFPNLKPNEYQIISDRTIEYNCVAWAAGNSDHWWWPDNQSIYYWPEGAPRLETVNGFVETFRGLGYEPCDSDQYEPGFEKVALYADEATGAPKHMARQVESGIWTSKLGPQHDIEHRTLSGLEGDEYGKVVLIMRRPHIQGVSQNGSSLLRVGTTGGSASQSVSDLSLSYPSRRYYTATGRTSRPAYGLGP